MPECVKLLRGVQEFGKSDLERHGFVGKRDTLGRGAKSKIFSAIKYRNCSFRHGCCQIWPDLQIWAAQIWPDLGKIFFFFGVVQLSPRLDFFFFHIKLDRARGVRLLCT